MVIWPRLEKNEIIEKRQATQVALTHPINQNIPFTLYQPATFIESVDQDCSTLVTSKWRQVRDMIALIGCSLLYSQAKAFFCMNRPVTRLEDSCHFITWLFFTSSVLWYCHRADRTLKPIPSFFSSLGNNQGNYRVVVPSGEGCIQFACRFYEEKTINHLSCHKNMVAYKLHGGRSTAGECMGSEKQYIFLH